MRIERNRKNDLSHEDALFSHFFRRAKRAGLLVSVFDEWGRTLEGRIYRNSTDRVVILGIGTGREYTELYYPAIRRAHTIGPVPEGLPPLFGDWDYVLSLTPPYLRDTSNDKTAQPQRAS